MTVDILHLLLPTFLISAECLQSAFAGDLVEARLGEQKQSAVAGLLQREFNQRWGLVRIIDVGIDRVGMPGERKYPLRFLCCATASNFRCS
jgi:hypothetical protein